MGLLWTLASLTGLPGELLAAAGLIGLYALLAGRRGIVGGLAKVGLLLALVPTVCYVGLWALQYLTQPYYYAPEGASLFSVVSFGYGYVRPGGILLLGTAALWIRGLGRWRVLPLVIALFSAPLTDLLLYSLFPPEPFDGTATSITGYLFVVPWVLVGLGWMVLGFVMWDAKKREDDLRIRDRRQLEQANLDRARRLYAGAWGEGDFAVLEEIVSPDVVDHGRGERGRESLGRGVADLRRSFPDLRFWIEGQSTEGDEVVTRWEMRGTDRGGVLWYPPTGKEATFTGTYADRFSDGWLVEHRAESDTSGLLRQLGLPVSG